MDPCSTCGDDGPIDSGPSATCHSTFCLDCKTLEDLGDQISNAKAHLGTLVATHQRFKDRLHQAHKYTIGILPVELMAWIFELVVGRPVRFQMVEEEEGEKESCMSPVVLGAICRSWRNIAWSTPNLWASLKFHFGEYTTKDHIDFAMDWLRRSGQLPLFIQLTAARSTPGYLLNSSTFWTPLIQCLNQNSYRWHTLILDVPHPIASRISDRVAGALNLNAIYFKGISCYGAPGITRAMPSFVNGGNVPPRYLYFRWDKLLYISSEAFLVNEVMELMQNAHLLESCKFRIMARNSVQAPSSQLQRSAALAPLTAARLVSLEIHFPRPDVTGITPTPKFLNKVTCPALRRCTFSFEREVGTIDPLLSFFVRSGQRLEELAIKHISLSGEHLIKIARLTPLLKKFDLILDSRIQKGGQLDQFYEALSELQPNPVSLASNAAQAAVEPLLLRLEHFELLGFTTGSTFQADNLSRNFPADLIEGLFTLCPGHEDTNLRPLKFVKVTFVIDAYSRYPIPYVDEKSLDRISQLRKAGVTVKLDVTHKRRHRDLISMSVKKRESNRWSFSDMSDDFSD